MDARPLAVVDLDGVVADVRHRLHFLASTPRDWDGFFAGIGDDPPLAEGLAVVRRLVTDHDLVYLTGRPEWTRAATEQWLHRHGLPRADVIMRRRGDRRPARVVKARLLRELADGRRVGVVVDDDHQVCDALEREGWPVLRADWMHGADELDVAQERLGRT